MDLSLAGDTRTDPKAPFTSARSWLGFRGERDRNITDLDKESGYEIKFHSSVRERWDDPDMNYHPKNLENFWYPQSVQSRRNKVSEMILKKMEPLLQYLRQENNRESTSSQ